MTKEEEKIMQMISYAGTGRTKLIQAMRKAAQGDYDEAYDLINQSDEDIRLCHTAQTEVLFKNAAKNSELNISVLLIHAMDQVMDTMNMRDMVKEMINLVKEREEKNND